jgi:N6-L-threonylcarbamoyladenine synthase
VRDHGIAPLTERPSGIEEVPGEILDLLAGFQEVVVKTLVTRTLKALDRLDVRCVGVVGGVACNQRLRERMTEACAERHLPVYIPSPPLCADNGAMIAAAGRPRLEAGERDPSSLSADPGWQIGI